MDAASVDNVVAQYLKKRGYAQAEAALKAEARVTGVSFDDLKNRLKLESDAAVVNYIMFYNQEENVRTRYDESYSKFRDWVHTSLDLYKPELLAMLFPVFVHCYIDLVAKGYFEEARKFMEAHRKDHDMQHNLEVMRLSAVNTLQLMQESELVKNFRNNKFSIKICGYAFELMLTFLQDHKFMLLLSIINQYINIKSTRFRSYPCANRPVYGGQPNHNAMEELPAATITGSTDASKREVFWGLLEDSRQPNKESEEDAAKKAGKKPAGKKPADAFPEAPRIKSRVSLPTSNLDTEAQREDDVRNRIALSSNTAPSVCFYTFTNTHATLNCTTITSDGSSVAAGGSDSIVRLWDLKKRAQTQNLMPHQPNVANNTVYSDDYTSLVGHSGPVYGASFSPDNQFLLTSSEDTTVRLWSMEMKTDLVSYKGHNYPVWDVEFSPLGYYFATASHDRTARIWSTDHIFPLRVLAGHLSDVECVKFHPNCNYVATGSSDKTIRLWEVASGECVRLFTGHYGSVHTLAFSPDGKCLASAGEDKSIVLWDIGSGQKIRTLVGHTKTVWSVNFSHEGAVLASGSADQTVRLWDINRARNLTYVPPEPVEEDTEGKRKKRETSSPELLQTFCTKQTPVFHTHFTPRNLLLAAGSFSSSIQGTPALQ